MEDTLEELALAKKKQTAVEPGINTPLLNCKKNKATEKPWPEEAGLSAFLPSAMPIILLALVCLLFVASGCSLHPSSDLQTSGKRVPGASISKTALKTVGTRYVYGGASPSKGFDCSGLVSWAYSINGVTLPRTAKAQSKVGSSVSKGALKAGDVVVFKISSGLHTGIYAGKGKFVHSPSTGKKVRIDDINNTYWKNKFIAGRRHAKVY